MLNNSHTILVFVKNKPGVLQKIIELLHQKNYSIEQISAGPSETGTITRLTIALNSHVNDVHAVISDINSISEVIKAVELKKSDTIQIEVALIKVKLSNGLSIQNRTNELNSLIYEYSGHVANLQKDWMIVQVAGEIGMINEFIKKLKKFKILEIARSGIAGMEK